MTGEATGQGTSAPTERLDMGTNGNIVIRTDPGNDSSPDNAGYRLISEPILVVHIPGVVRG